METFDTLETMVHKLECGNIPPGVLDFLAMD